ncbi:MAG: peptide-methionine (R)-S-oxide reductase MsrB [Proteobacteria bacterium]|nr:peptide-methionine (R)-S-oxide reductase MsrB [Pseudomonadota bacterium]
MNRRHFISSLFIMASAPWLASKALAKKAVQTPAIKKITKTAAEWRKLLSPQQYEILRDEGTERAFTSPLNDEKRKGTYVCAGCALPLFSSDMKYDSGTGWPSFFKTLPGAVETSTDFKLIYPRTEYHCARCGGHQGHVFKDGPKPSGQRWCNNGLALKFIKA